MAELRGTRRRKAPHSSLEKVGQLVLPDVAHRFLFGPDCEFPFARLLVGAVFGAISGAALFFGIGHNISLSSFHKVTAGYIFVALCVLGGMLSLHFRCSVLLVFPSMLGSQGRAYVMVFVLHCLYQGPISNIQHNVQEVVFSMGCNIDLQIRHSKVMWRLLTEPFTQVLQEIVDDNVILQKEARNVSEGFQAIRDEVMGEYGYDALGQNQTDTGNSTQEQYTAKTAMRCDHVVKTGIERCREWFRAKWLECMDAIKSPVINHFVCVPMKFEFLCNVMRVMTPWCKDQIPVEGNFGQTFDRLSSSIDKLGEQFTTDVVLEKSDQQSMLGVTALKDEFRKELRTSFQEKRDLMDQIVKIVQILLSFTFITVFASAYGYARQYNRDIRFDNVYITTYFRQIDERRNTAGRRFLLPLKKAEKSDFIDPRSLKIHSSELQLVIGSLVQVVSLAVFVCVLLATNGVLYHIFDIIRRHTFTESSYTSSHDVHIDIGGDSMLAKLLRRTIGAFNTSSNINLHSSNQECLPQPRALSRSDYLWSTLPVLLMGVMCCLQVYTNRLRRVIAAFYFPKLGDTVALQQEGPGSQMERSWSFLCGVCMFSCVIMGFFKREKRRILFLYNLQIQRRIQFVNRQCKQLRRQRQAPKPVLSMLLSPLERLGCGVCWCWVCTEWMRQRRAVRCSVLGCTVLYCAQCWRDLGSHCVCTYPKDKEPRDGDSDSDTVYYVG